MDINHPVHIVHGDGLSMSPSAFIPFCEFGGDMSVMGIKIEQFDNPVCNCFKARVLNDQLCYEVDLEDFKSSSQLHRQLKLGLVFFMDYNEDKQLILENSSRSEDILSRGQAIDGSNEEENAFIYLNTIGEYYIKYYFQKKISYIYIIYHHFYSQEPVKLVGGGKFNLNSVREIKVTESYLGLDQSVKACKDEEEPQHDCTTTLYTDASLNNCGCLPLSIRNDKKVFIMPV